MPQKKKNAQGHNSFKLGLQYIYNFIKPTYQLNGYHQHGFEWETSATKVKEVFQTWAQEFQHHGIVLTTRAEVIHLWDALCITQTQKSSLQLAPFWFSYKLMSMIFGIVNLPALPNVL